jgi:hypothetical protein
LLIEAMTKEELLFIGFRDDLDESPVPDFGTDFDR